MASVVQKVINSGALLKGSYPQFVKNNTILEVVMGSEAYGISTDKSDKDIYGICIPSKDIIFPSEFGKMWGFDKYNEFKVWQNHHVSFNNAIYDFSIYNIVSFFKLLHDGNPNIIDSIFVPRECILYSTPISEHIILNRNIFLHTQCCYKYIGYANSQISKLSRKPEGKRLELYEKFGYDVKYASHAVRLLLEREDIIENGTLDLRKNSDMLRSIRDGNWTQDEVKKWVRDKEQALLKSMSNSKLPKKPRTAEIKNLLNECLDHFYGTKSEDNKPKQLDHEKIRDAIDILQSCLNS